MTHLELLQTILKMLKNDKEKIDENSKEYIKKIKSLIERHLKNG